MQERLSEMWGSRAFEGSVVVRYVMEPGDLLIRLNWILCLVKISSISVASGVGGGKGATRMVTEYMYLVMAKRVQLNIRRL